MMSGPDSNIIAREQRVYVIFFLIDVELMSCPDSNLKPLFSNDYGIFRLIAVIGTRLEPSLLRVLELACRPILLILG